MQPPHSLWWSTLETPVAPRASLHGDLDVDVAIVGGGFTGLWTARELLRRDSSLQIAVLEQSVCGFGASGRNGGWASSLYPLSDEAVIARHGKDAFDRLRVVLQQSVASLGTALARDGVDAHFVHGGTLNYARSDVQAARLREAVTAAHRNGASEDDLRWLNADEARARGELSDVRGATFSPHCARIHPARLVRGLANVDERLGATIFEGTTVTRIIGTTGTTSARVVTPLGTVRARYVVRATEGFTATLPGERRRLAPLYSLSDSRRNPKVLRSGVRWD